MEKEIWKNLDLQPLDGEEWRSVKGYEGRYEVSNFGRVKSTADGTEQIMRQMYVRKTQRLRIGLWKDGGKKKYFVHRLVAMAFCIGYKDTLVVNHKNENPSDNRADNLEWITARENFFYGTRIDRIGKAKGKRVRQLTMDGKVVAEYTSSVKAAQAIGKKSGSSIRKCCDGITYTVQGFRWEWCDDNSHKYVPAPIGKPVLQLSLDGVVIAEYANAGDAVEALGKPRSKSGNIRECCRGTMPTAFGYKWKYKNDKK